MKGYMAILLILMSLVIIFMIKKLYDQRKENFTSIKKKFLIVRILGNDLRNLHGNTQTFHNLKFTLENETYLDQYVD